MKEIKHITLKGNPALQDLSDFLEITPNEIRERIITTLLNHGFITDKIMYCGSSLRSILEQHHETIENFSKYCFRASYDKLLVILEGIIIWGLEHDCPICGCKTYIEGKEKICIRGLCDFSISLNPEKASFPSESKIYLN
jgi:hypothetical protein